LALKYILCILLNVAFATVRMSSDAGKSVLCGWLF